MPFERFSKISGDDIRASKPTKILSTFRISGKKNPILYTSSLLKSTLDIPLMSYALNAPCFFISNLIFYF